MASYSDNQVDRQPNDTSPLDRAHAPKDPAHPIRNPDLANAPEQPIATLPGDPLFSEGNAASNDGHWEHDKSGPAEYVVSADKDDPDAPSVTTTELQRK